jgi:hypothetical protein
MANAFRISCSAYHFLLILYPHELRNEFGDDMMDVFAEQMSGQWNRHGVVGVVRVWLIAGWEVMSVAAPLQLRNPLVIAGALSFVCSSVLALAFFRSVSPP